MLTVTNDHVMNFENAVRGARNPMNSWDKIDSEYNDDYTINILQMELNRLANIEIKNTADAKDITKKIQDITNLLLVLYHKEDEYKLGENDLKLLVSLCKAGSDHRKFMRQILVCMDVNAPLYWWKEFDTYKVGTTANSTSTMHKIHSKTIELDDFSIDYLTDNDKTKFKDYLSYLEKIRLEYIETKEHPTWKRLIQMLPSNYNQLRTITCSYENLFNMYHARKDHKLQEWKTLCSWIATLPYAQELIVGIKG